MNRGGNQPHTKCLSSRRRSRGSLSRQRGSGDRTGTGEQGTSRKRSRGIKHVQLTSIGRRRECQSGSIADTYFCPSQLGRRFIRSTSTDLADFFRKEER